MKWQEYLGITKSKSKAMPLANSVYWVIGGIMTIMFIVSLVNGTPIWLTILSAVLAIPQFLIAMKFRKANKSHM